jgi:diadenosine tetraphosphate (Ap4A) HIT family hydrolase
MVAHLHWHVIARFDWDSHFPAPVWAAAVRERALEKEDAVRALLPVLEAQLRKSLGLRS